MLNKSIAWQLNIPFGATRPPLQIPRTLEHCVSAESIYTCHNLKYVRTSQNLGTSIFLEVERYLQNLEAEISKTLIFMFKGPRSKIKVNNKGEKRRSGLEAGGHGGHVYVYVLKFRAADVVYERVQGFVAKHLS